MNPEAITAGTIVLILVGVFLAGFLVAAVVKETRDEKREDSYTNRAIKERVRLETLGFTLSNYVSSSQWIEGFDIHGNIVEHRALECQKYIDRGAFFPDTSHVCRCSNCGKFKNN